MFNQLKKYLGTNLKVRIERNYNEDRYINGVIHKMSDTYILMQQFHDFTPEGYAIIRLKDVVGFRSGKYDRYFDYIIKEEGIIDQIVEPLDIPLDNMKNIINYFSKSNQHIIIEIENSSDNDEYFYIGKIVQLENNVAWFRAYDADGKWEDEEVGIDIELITKLQFDTPYINIISKYVGPK